MSIFAIASGLIADDALKSVVTPCNNPPPTPGPREQVAALVSEMHDSAAKERQNERTDKHAGKFTGKSGARDAADKAVRVAGRPRNYTPTTHPVNAFKALAKLAYTKRSPGGPAEGPLALSITFIMPRPRNKVWKRKPMPRYCHAKRPDLDNLVKAVLDALNGLAWRDDAQIHTLHISKVVAAGDEQPHVQLRIAEEACNMMACDSCPFTTDDHTVAACPKCNRALVYEPTAEEIAQATAKIRAGWSRRKRAMRLAGPEQPVEIQHVTECSAPGEDRGPVA